ncbi:MAG: hypothetical protein VXZ24_00720 [Pseudomonadota bacterium]|nr:hypothetical protein [Pseudomonadota bacterium]
MKSKWALLIFLSYGVLLLLMSAFKTAELLLPQITWLEQALGGDKWMHFKLSILLAVLACLASTQVLDLRPISRALVVFGVLLFALALDEALQYGLASRRFELLDLAYGSAGLLCGTLGYFVVGTLRGKSSTSA